MWFSAHSPTRDRLTIRWASRADLDQLAAVERAVHGPDAVPPHRLEAILQQKGFAALLAETDHAAGYLLYDLDVTQRTVHIDRLAVVPPQRRQGIGTRLLQKLVHRLHGLPEVRTCLLVHEGNLPGQLFAKARGFRATQIYPRFFADADAYLFELQPLQPTSSRT